MEEERDRIKELARKVIEIVRKKESKIENQKSIVTDETRVEVRKLKRTMDEREKKKRNNLVIKELKKEKKSI